MWTYFAIPQNASLPAGETSPVKMMEVILSKIELLGEDLNATKAAFNPWGATRGFSLFESIKSEAEEKRKAEEKALHQALQEFLSSPFSVAPKEAEASKEK